MNSGRLSRPKHAPQFERGIETKGLFLLIAFFFFFTLTAVFFLLGRMDLCFFCTEKKDEEFC